MERENLSKRDEGQMGVGVTGFRFELMFEINLPFGYLFWRRRTLWMWCLLGVVMSCYEGRKAR